MTCLDVTRCYLPPAVDHVLTHGAHPRVPITRSHDHIRYSDGLRIGMARHPRLGVLRTAQRGGTRTAARRMDAAHGYPERRAEKPVASIGQVATICTHDTPFLANSLLVGRNELVAVRLCRLVHDGDCVATRPRRREIVPASGSVAQHRTPQSRGGHCPGQGARFGELGADHVTVCACCHASTANVCMHVCARGAGAYPVFSAATTQAPLSWMSKSWCAAQLVPWPPFGCSIFR